jgi:hypothetical protein
MARLPGPKFARPAIVQTMRHTQTVTTDAGDERTIRSAAGGVVVRVKADADSRRNFRKFCARHGLLVWAAERCHGDYRHRAPRVAPDYREDFNVSAWNVAGPGEALALLVGPHESGDVALSNPKPFVDSWHYAMNTALPRAASGSGPEKARPSMGSAFGKPAQVAATAVQLAADHADRMRAAGIYADAE